MRYLWAAVALFWLPGGSAAAQAPIIDVHLHALPADSQGPVGVELCAPFGDLPTWDPSQPYAPVFIREIADPSCRVRLKGALTDDALRENSLAIMEEYNVIGIASGPRDLVATWHDAAPDRIIRGLGFNLSNARTEPEALRSMHEDGTLEVLAEVTIQYDGLSPADPLMARYWAVAAELDMPVGIHMGPGPPGAPYLGSNFRASMGDPLLLEPVLAKHPNLRVYLMHAGFPMAERTRALLYAHPQVYVGLGVISFTQPKAIFDGFLCELVEAGFGKRIMFGSDQMVWPEAIPIAIANVNAAPCLSDQQKRNILYNNAARFLRLDPETIARHQAMGE